MYLNLSFVPTPRRRHSRTLLWTPALALAATLTPGAAAGEISVFEEAIGNELQDHQSLTRAAILPIAPVIDQALTAHLITLLGDPSWETRRRAQAELIELGPAVLPAVVTARRHSADPQLHVALELVEEGIARRQAERGRLILLALESAPATDALREMARQAGVDVRPDSWSLGNLQIDARWGGTGWWPALLELCERYDLDVRVSGGSLSVLRGTNDAPRLLGGPVSMDGPIIVMARGASYQRSVDLARMPRPRPGQEGTSDQARRGTRFRYDFEALLEPRFQLGTRRFDVVITRAQDDAGNWLLTGGGLADGADLGRELGAAGGGAGAGSIGSTTPGHWSNGRLRFEVDLRYPAEPGEYLQIAGRIRGLAGADLYDLRIPAAQLIQGSLWQVADEQLEARLERAPSGRWALIVQSSRIVSAEVSDVISASLNSLELLDAGNIRLRRGAFQTSVGDDGRLSVRVEFTGPSEESLPDRLLGRVPRRAVEMDLPFEFHNLPMP